MFTIIIPFYNKNESFRLRNLLYVIKNYLDIAPDFELLIIEQNGTGYIEKELSNIPFVRYLNLIIDSNEFHKTRLLNYAVDNTTSDYILMADADCIITKTAIDILRVDYCKGSVVYPFNSVDYYNETFTRKLIKNEYIPLHKLDYRGLPIKRFTGMVNCFSRNTYEVVGKFDEAFIGWGVEDDAFLNKCERLCGASYRTIIDSPLIHLYHPKSDNPIYKTSDLFISNKKRGAVIQRMSDDDLYKYANGDVTLDSLVSKYEELNLLELTLKWDLNNAVVTLDSTIYNVGSFDNMSITRILKIIYDTDGRDFMLYIIDLIENKVKDLTESQKDEITLCRAMCV